MIANALLVFGVATFTLLLVDLLLGQKHKRALATWTVRFWYFLDDVRKKAVEGWIGFGWFFREPPPSNDHTDYTDEELKMLSQIGGGDFRVTTTGLVSVMIFSLILHAVLVWSGVAFVSAYGARLWAFITALDPFLQAAALLVAAPVTTLCLLIWCGSVFVLALAAVWSLGALIVLVLMAFELLLRRAAEYDKGPLVALSLAATALAALLKSMNQ